MSFKETLGLHNLVAARGTKPKRRVGRGESSGRGKTSGRGHKGQNARKSGNVRPGFEGGQIPLARRLPKRGFSNAVSRITFRPINLNQLAERFPEGGIVDVPALIEAGLISNAKNRVKLLGTGEVTKVFQVKLHAVSGSAKAKVEQAGGSISVLD